MATEDKLNDYDFTGTDAGASHTIPSEAGQIRKGGYIVIKGHPCKVRGQLKAKQMKVSRPERPGDGHFGVVFRDRVMVAIRIIQGFIYVFCCTNGTAGSENDETFFSIVL